MSERNMSSVEEYLVSEEDLERIRSRTFTQELRSLVDKVTADSSESGSDDVIADDDQLIETKKIQFDKDIVKSLHGLFYRTINIEASSGFHTGFNPFVMNDEPIYEYAKDYIKKSLSEVNVSEYAMLFFDPPMKSFIPGLYEIADYSKDMLVISPEDALYKHVISDAIGLVIAPDSPYRNEFSRKHFIGDFENATVYIISIQNLLNIFWSCYAQDFPSMFAPTALYPLFICIYRDPTQFNHRELMNILQKRCSFAFYILFNHLRRDRMPAEFRSPSFLCSLVDTYGMIFGHLDNTRCVLIQHNGSYQNSSYLLMNYIERKLSILCGPNSTPLFFEKNKIIIFISSEDYEAIMNFLKEFIVLSDGEIDISEINDFGHINLFSVLKS